MRWKCICAYDGTDFDGWQTQPKKTAVQDHIETALGQIFDSAIRIQGSGRTDAGVHARGQCFHFDADWRHPPANLIRALEVALPETISIRSLQRAEDDFHARHSATGKRYRYRFHLGRTSPFETRFVWSCKGHALDLEKMQAASRILLGKHDFSAFAASQNGDADPNPVKTITRLDIHRHGRHFTLTTEGSGYLYRMVRRFTGALYDIGRGKLTADELREILRSKNSTHRIVTAPARGLCLDKVFY